MNMIISVLVLSFAVLFPQISTSLTAAEVYQAVEHSVYPVYGFDSESKGRQAAGTAVAVSRNLLVTNCHIARGANIYQVKIANHLKRAQLLLKDINHDLCFLKVPGEEFSPVQFRDSKNVEIGEEAYAIGNPYGLEKTISKGIISNKHQMKGASILQTDATISFGSSGGGLFDSKGLLIGITRAGHRNKDIAFAVPVEWITNALSVVEKVKLSGGDSSFIAHALKKNNVVAELSPEVLGRYGKDEVGLFRFKNSCFIALSGEQARVKKGVLIWYPKKPLMIYFMPYEKNIKGALGLLAYYGHLKTETGEIDLGKYNTGTGLPSILQSADLITKKFNQDPLVKILKGRQLNFHYPDAYDSYKEMTTNFGLLGFKKALESYEVLCKTH